MKLKIGCRISRFKVSRIEVHDLTLDLNVNTRNVTPENTAHNVLNNGTVNNDCAAKSIGDTFGPDQ